MRERLKACPHCGSHEVVLRWTGEVTRFYRDLYVSQVGRTYPEEYMLPWEAKK